ncbi:hypothetical protein [Microbacterium sp. gxy059]|uniref:hypothetical protein n=1 Tax=Microbacterium sp. gxy059 TaxID=2957199 RepID=UPI003D969C06
MLTTVTGNLYDHTGKAIPAGSRPELFFRPRQSNVVDASALAGVEAQATLNAATGAFTVRLEAHPGVTYRMVARWLTNPEERSPERWGFQYTEWPIEIDPYPIGGSLDDLVAQNATHPLMVLVQLDDPPLDYTGLWLDAAPGDETEPTRSGSGMLRMVYA